MLNDPVGPDLQVVITCLTTKRDYSDPTVTLQPGDHPFVSRPTAVDYSRTKVVFAGNLETLLKSGATSAHADCNGALVRRIAAGLLDSDQTPQWIAGWYRLNVANAE